MCVAGLVSVEPEERKTTQIAADRVYVRAGCMHVCMYAQTPGEEDDMTRIRRAVLSS